MSESLGNRQFCPTVGAVRLVAILCERAPGGFGIGRAQSVFAFIFQPGCDTRAKSGRHGLLTSPPISRERTMARSREESAPTPSPGTQVLRRVYFYAVRAASVNGQPRQTFRYQDIFTQVNAIDEGDDSRYLDLGHPTRTYCWVDDLSAKTSVRLGRTEMDDVPIAERKGKLTPFKLKEDQGASYLMHAVFFPTGIIGWEFNLYGPKANDIRRYVEAVVGPDHVPVFFPLVSQDALDRIKDSYRVAKFHIQLPFAAIDALASGRRDDGGILNVLSDMQNLVSAESISVTVGMGRRGDGLRTDSIINMLPRLEDFLEANPKYRSHSSIQAWCQRDEDERRQVKIDLLRDRLVHQVTMMRKPGRTEAVDANSAYEQITKLYARHKEEIESAVHLFLEQEGEA